MGWFSKDQEKEETLPELPKLPALPNLPSSRLPEIPKEEKPISEPMIKDLPEVNELPRLPDKKEIHQLPTFPNNKTGDKFSQDSIKSAIEGSDMEKEKSMEQSPREFNIMTEPLEKDSDIEERIIPREETPITSKMISNEPIFIRIDKFEESMNSFENIKHKLTEIEHLLNETKEIKDKEQEELSKWEHEVQKIKSHFEKIDKDIFSKIQ
jgi:hypothetical protein